MDVASADRENQEAFLENQGYEVFVAESGETAQQLCLQVQPDLVLLYEHLPQLGGAALCWQLKQDPLNKLTPIVLISSASATPTKIAQGREAGAADFWGTPCSLQDGLGRVDTFLRLKSYIDEQAKAAVLTYQLLLRPPIARRPVTFSVHVVV